MGVPKGVDPLAWRLAVNDTLALASAGFAVQALDLGWSMLDLFGGSRDREADPQSDGLGVWLQGRRVIAFTVDHAVAADTSGGRHYFNRPRASGAALLWEIAR